MIIPYVGAIIAELYKGQLAARKRIVEVHADHVVAVNASGRYSKIKRTTLRKFVDVL